MRIAFLTGCMERGRDGVGDYTRDLAAACMRAGHTAMIIALNDRFVEAEEVDEPQLSRTGTVEVLRLSSRQSIRDRVTAARTWLAARNADWISLQFVPYAFHPKGIVTGLERHIAAIAGERRLHIMFHEIWIGAERGASLGHRLMGRLQRSAMLRLVRTLRPAAMHTSNPAYAALLGHAGVPTRLLPLCGSVPIVPFDAQWLPGQLERLAVPADHIAPREDCWWFGMFGSLHLEWSAEPLFSYIAGAAGKDARRIVVAAIGHQRVGEQMWRDLQKHYAGRIALCALGERNESEISTFLQSVDFGIGTTPWQLIGKSATAAAMIDHGLPVIVSRDDISFDIAAGPVPEPLLYRMDEQLPAWLGRTRRVAPQDRLPAMASRFLEDLSA